MISVTVMLRKQYSRTVNRSFMLPHTFSLARISARCFEMDLNEIAESLRNNDLIKTYLLGFPD
jgi:hypothetical protein